MQTLYTAVATATGGRDGRAVSSDNILDVKLSTPKELGGAGGQATNPEQLFAAGYSACFIGALKFVASQTKRKIPDDASITAHVGIGQIPGGFGLDIDLRQPAGPGPGGCAKPGRRRPPGMPLFQRHPWQRGCALACNSLINRRPQKARHQVGLFAYRRGQNYFLARPLYEPPSRVSISIRSSISMKSATCSSVPLLSLAGFITLPEVSPRAEPSV